MLNPFCRSMVCAALALCLVAPASASAWRPPTEQERAELTAAAAQTEPGLHPKLKNVRVSSQNETLASAEEQTSGIGVRWLFTHILGSPWKVLGYSAAEECLEPGSVHISKSVERELGVCIADWRFVYAQFSAKPQVHPRTFALGNQAMLQLHWRGWGKGKLSGLGRAYGTGIYPYNDCKPFCADGHITNYPVKVQLSLIEECHGRLYYMSLRYRLPRRSPLGNRWYSETLSCNKEGNLEYER